MYPLNELKWVKYGVCIFTDGCIFTPLWWTNRTQRNLNFESIEGQCQSTPKASGLLIKVFCIVCPNLLVPAVERVASYWPDKRVTVPVKSFHILSINNILYIITAIRLAINDAKLTWRLEDIFMDAKHWHHTICHSESVLYFQINANKAITCVENCASVTALQTMWEKLIQLKDWCDRLTFRHKT